MIGVIYNIVFALALAILQPWILPPLSEAIYDDRPFIALGVIVAILILVEHIAMPIKMRAIRSRRGHSSDSAAAIWLWALHMVSVVFLIMTVFKLFGADFEAHPYIGLGIIIPMVVANLIILLAGTQKKVDKWKERAADGAVFLYAFVGFTAMWGTWVYNGIERTSGGFGAWLFDASGMVILFFLLYLPLQIPFLYEEFGPTASKSQKRYALMSLALAAVVAVYLGLSA